MLWCHGDCVGEIIHSSGWGRKNVTGLGWNVSDQDQKGIQKGIRSSISKNILFFCRNLTTTKQGTEELCKVRHSSWLLQLIGTGEILLICVLGSEWFPPQAPPAMNLPPSWQICLWGFNNTKPFQVKDHSPARITLQFMQQSPNGSHFPPDQNNYKEIKLNHSLLSVAPVAETTN